MSKTDKTKPFYLKLAHGDLDWEEVHDHTEGPCDLPPVTDVDSYWKRDTRCWRTFVYTGTHVCCCHHCHSSDAYALRPGKRQRLASKRAVRDWENESGHTHPCYCEDCMYEYLVAEGYFDEDDEDENRLFKAQPEAARYLGVSKL